MRLRALVSAAEAAARSRQGLLTAHGLRRITALIDAIAADDFDTLGQFGCILQRASLRTSELPLTVSTPTLVVQGEDDDLVYTPVVRDDLPKLCDQGYIIEHYECAGLGHTDAATSSIPHVIDWVNARIAGEELTDPCVIHAPVDCVGP